MELKEIEDYIKARQAEIEMYEGRIVHLKKMIKDAEVLQNDR